MSWGLLSNSVLLEDSVSEFLKIDIAHFGSDTSNKVDVHVGDCVQS